MNTEDLKKLVKNIVEEATILKNKHIDFKDIPINYACIFSQSEKEYQELLEISRKIGTMIKETPSGFLFHISPLETISGTLKLLKIRFPDSTRPERGDADFTISNFSRFEKKYLSKKGFKLIKKENFYMIELMDPKFNVRAYFSNPPLDLQLNIK
ncbi:hypothetical protein CEE44_03690 [Candidatus Woesearchaeota archaeon B3_Woes]|nr:MAG: hypothetical protein CEE44_03690 [Candidatus Woesearchaeota archaeon B3_Woes]